MSIEFYWTDEATPPPREPPKPPRKLNFRRWALLLLVGVGLAGGAWFTQQALSRPSSAEIAQALESLLTAEAAAVAIRDGAALSATQPDDAQWQAAQLWPASQAMLQAGRTVHSINRTGSDIDVRLAWSTPAGVMTRTHFYQWKAGKLLPQAAAPGFWGATVQSIQPWGTLILPEADQDWSAGIGAAVGDAITTLCAANCLADRLPLTVEIRPDYANPYAPDRVIAPSPRLVAVDGHGAPGPDFQRLVEQRLTDYLAPAVIRFAVPALDQSNYAAAAERFTRNRPDIRIEIVALDEMALVNLAEVDGALLTPTAEQAATGRLFDMTDFAATDPAFASADFYPFTLQGVRWRERMWAVPLAAEWSLFHADSAAYEAAALTPSPPATWSGLEAQTVQLRNAPDNQALNMIFADLNGDSLYSVAGAAHCAAAPGRCAERLDPSAIQGALSWYAGVMAAQPDSPDLTRMGQLERRNYALNNLSNPREIAAWIEPATYFEHNVQIAPLAISALPPGAQGASTPLHIVGGVISARSPHPRAVWEWLIFLSHGRPLNEPRRLPARASVTQQIAFWGKMPPNVRSAMLAGLEDGRVVRMDEQELFRANIIEALLTGAAPPAILAEQALEIRWFDDFEGEK